MGTNVQKNIEEFFALPFLELVYRAQTVHQKYFNPSEIEMCVLLSVKTGGCPEDCQYCPQSAHYKTKVKKEPLWEPQEVLKAAQKAKSQGAKRFCMVGAWRSPPEAVFPKIINMIQAVKALGMETCLSAGMLQKEQALQLKAAGLDYYNHNLDTSPEFYKTIVRTRTYAERIETLGYVGEAGLGVCCGGILGMGESREDRVQLLVQLASLKNPPTSIPINRLIRVHNTPLENNTELDPFEFVRTIAVARLLFPKARIRLSGARKEMSPELQAWCWMAGANSFFYGDVLLTQKNQAPSEDALLFQKLGIRFQHVE